MVFYRLGESIRDKSVCILLCDPWFEDKKAKPTATSGATNGKCHFIPAMTARLRKSPT